MKRNRQKEETRKIKNKRDRIFKWKDEGNGVKRKENCEKDKFLLIVVTAFVQAPIETREEATT